MNSFKAILPQNYEDHPQFPQPIQTPIYDEPLICFGLFIERITLLSCVWKNLRTYVYELL